MKTRRRLATTRHTVFELADSLLLVFKPRGHAEPEHAHAHRQRLRILRGGLVVRTRTRSRTLRPASPPLTLPAGRAHTTVALEDTWLTAEALPAKRRRSDPLQRAGK